MSEIASVWVSVVPSFKGGQKAIEKEFGGAGDPAGKKAGKGFLGGLGASLGGAGKLAAGSIAVVGTALAGIAVKGGIDRALNIEDARAKLKGLGHETQSVDGIMQNALASVSGTAYGLGDAAAVAAGVVAAGVQPGQDLERTLKLVGDAATIAGTDMGTMGSIFNKVASSDMIQGDVLAQLGDAGIPILQLLSKELGVSTEEVRKLASDGAINFATFQSAMETGMGGAALASGDTFRGSLANTGAALGRIGETFISPFLTSLQGGLTGAIPMLDSLNTSLKPIMESFGEWLSTNLPIFIDNISTAVSTLAGWVTGTAIPALQSFGSWFSANQGTITTVAIIIGAVLTPALVRLGIQATLAGAKTAVAWVMMVAGAVGAGVAYVVQSAIIVASWVLMGAQALLAGARMAAAWLLAMGPVGLVIALVVGLVALIIANWGKVKTFTVAVFSAIGTFLKAAWTGIVNTVMIAVNAVKTAISFAFQLVKTIFTGVWDFIVGYYATIWGLLTGQSTGAADQIRQIIFTAFEAIKTFLVNIWNTVLGFLAGVWAGIQATATNTFNAVVGFVAGIPGRILAGLAALGELGARMGEWVAGMYNAAVTKFGEIVTYVSGIPGNILSALGNTGTLLLDAGGQILQGFLDGLKAGFENVKDFVGGIGSWIADNKGPKAYDLALLVPAGSWIMSGLEKGIEQSMPSLGSTLGDVSWMIANGIDPGVTAGVKANVSASAPVGALASSPVTGAGAAGSGVSITQHIEANDTEGVVQEVMGRLRFEFAKQGVRLGG